MTMWQRFYCTDILIWLNIIYTACVTGLTVWPWLNIIIMLKMAPWPSGKAEVCKTFTAGSNPAGAL